jgi:hypothetical protein
MATKTTRPAYGLLSHPARIAITRVTNTTGRRRGHQRADDREWMAQEGCALRHGVSLFETLHVRH